MGNLLPKLTQVETTTKESSNKNMEQLKHLAHEFMGINGRQFEALYSCITEEMKDARDQDLARALRSMQEKMDQNSEETATKLSNILKEVEKVTKDLVAKKINISSEEMQQIDAVKDDIRKLKEGVHVPSHQMKLRKMAEDEIKTALKSLKDELKDVTEELKSVKNVATNREKVVTCELRNVKEELRVVKEKTRGAKDEQTELTEAGLRKVVTDANLTTESNDKEGSAQTDHHVQNVRQAKTELDASREAKAKLINCNNMKRNRDSRNPTFEQNKKLRKQSTRDDEHGIASVSRKIVYPSSTSSSESDSTSSSESASSASAVPSKSNLKTNLDFDSDSSESDSDF